MNDENIMEGDQSLNFSSVDSETQEDQDSLPEVFSLLGLLPLEVHKEIFLKETTNVLHQLLEIYFSQSLSTSEK